jgi:hypothetical protein
MGFETNNYWADEGQQQYNRSTVELVWWSVSVGELISWEFGSRKSLQLGSCSGSQRGREALNMEVDGCTLLEAVTRQRFLKTQQTDKT